MEPVFLIACSRLLVVGGDQKMHVSEKKTLIPCRFFSSLAHVFRFPQLPRAWNRPGFLIGGIHPWEWGGLTHEKDKGYSLENFN